MKTQSKIGLKEPNLTTKRGQNAWVKKAIAAGSNELDARKTVEKMAAVQMEKLTSTLKLSKAPKEAQSLSPNDGDLFAGSFLPTLTEQPSSKTRVKKEQKTGSEVKICQLPFWPEIARSLPNEILRSALFNVTNHKIPRVMMKDVTIAIIGDGRITYRGEELRQDDETVWLQLVHLARHHVVGQLVEFTPNSFIKSIKWSKNGETYNRLRDSLKRMQATGLDVYSKRLDRGISLSMIPFFEYEDIESQKRLAKWRVRIAPEMVDLFGTDHYTRIEWEQRLSLPDGVATWLHGYLASHRVPHPIKIETIAYGSGMKDQPKSEIKRLIQKALIKLVNCGFLLNWSIEKDLVMVKRSHIGQLDR